MSMLTEGQLDKKAPKKRHRGQRIRRCIRRDLKRFFLHEFARCGNVSQTCRALLVARNTVYVWMRQDKAFAERYHALVNLLYPTWEPPQVTPAPLVGQMSDRALMVAFSRLNRRSRY